MLVALHARHAHDSVRRFHGRHPERPIVVAAAGTDVNTPGEWARLARESFGVATRIVLLQPMARAGGRSVLA